MINATIERLGVLSAESGAGKSSLLAAGYIPALRRKRAAKEGVPPVLFLRAWGGRASKAEDRILDGIREAVEDLHKRSEIWAEHASTLSDVTLKKRAESIATCIKDDHEELTKILKQFDFKGKPRDSALTEVLRALSDSEGLILILDQFEEFMGSASAEAGGDQRSAERVTQAVGRLFRDVPKVKILIALRTEYCRTLQRYLNIFVPNLDRRITDLSPLPAKSIIQIVRGVSGNGTPETDIVEFAGKLARASGAIEGDEGSNVSVLEVQALLYGYDAWCAAKNGPSDFTPHFWDQYVESLTKEPASYRSTARMPSGWSSGANPEKGVGGRALKQWVEGQLESAVNDSPSGQRARWMLLPVLPRLSTHGGYKQHLPLMALCLDLADRLSDGWGKLDTVALCVETWLKTREELQIKLDAMDLKALRQQGADRRTLEPKAVETTQNEIRKCLVDFKATIGSLESKAILKMSGNGVDESCELVHDGLSEHVRKWSEDLPKKPETLMGSPVDVVGERFAWRELGGSEVSTTIAGKVWKGCSVKGARITNVRFEGCELRGLSLTECILENVEFVQCEMQGAILIECSVTAVSFQNCKLNSVAFLHCVFAEKISFSGLLPKLEPGVVPDRKMVSDMTGVDFADDCKMQIGSQMVFSECLLRFAKIATFDYKGGNRMDFTKCDMMNAWVEDAGIPRVGIDQYCRTIGLLSFQQPPEGWLDREQNRAQS